MTPLTYYRKLSHKGALFIGAFEGFVPRCYNDIGGDAHIGFGHKLHDGPYTQADVNKWGTIDKDRAAELLQGDAREIVEIINKRVKVPLRQGQFDAVVSLGFNLGPYSAGLANVIGLLNQERPRDARKEFLKYDHVNGVQYPGLTRRRKAEALLFRSGFYFLNILYGRK
jgi:lysozyme